MLALFFCGEFLLHIPCCLHFTLAFFVLFVCLGSFSHTSRAVFILILGSFSYTSCAGFIFNWGVSLTHPTLASFLPGEFLLHSPCCFCFLLFCFFINPGSFSYTSRAGFIFIWEVSLTHPVLAVALPREFLLYIRCWLISYLGSFSYTSRAGYIFLWGVSFTYTMLALFFCGEFLFFY